MLNRTFGYLSWTLLLASGCNRTATKDASTSQDASTFPASTTPVASRANLPEATAAGRYVDTVGSVGAASSTRLSCEPKKISLTDTLVLTMKIPHGEYLTVNDPQGTAFFIIYPQLGDTSRKYSLIPSQSFRHITRLRLPADVKANPRVYGRDGLETLFNKSGKYVFQMGDNLEGDFGADVARCTVQFTNSK